MSLPLTGRWSRKLQQQAVACSWAWTSAYLEAYGDIVSHAFLVALRADQPVGVALVTRGIRLVRGVPIRSIRVGTAGEPRNEVYVEYNRLLVANEDRAEFGEAVLDYARRQRGWDEIRLDGFVIEDAQALMTAGRWQTVTEQCPVMDLERVEDTSTLFSKNTRYRIRRSMRSLEPLTLEWAEDEEHALDILQDLTLLHEARWASSGQPGVLGGTLGRRPSTGRSCGT